MSHSNVVSGDSSAASKAAGTRTAKALDSSVKELKSQNQALQRENEELRRFAQYRSGFLSQLAHELRTPLTAILGFAEILLNQEELTETQYRFCERIEDSARQLQSNLSLLADLSRLEAGQSELFLEEFSLADLLRESCAALARLAQKQNTKLESGAVDGLAVIVSDRAKLRQVLVNYLGYAISRSSNGAVIQACVEENARGFVLKITDDGEPPPDLARVDPGEFDFKTQLSSDELRLVIARQLIDSLGATLKVQNREPSGLEVLIQLPKSPPKNATVMASLRE